MKRKKIPKTVRTMHCFGCNDFTPQEILIKGRVFIPKTFFKDIEGDFNYVAFSHECQECGWERLDALVVNNYNTLICGKHM